MGVKGRGGSRVNSEFVASKVSHKLFLGGERLRLVIAALGR